MLKPLLISATLWATTAVGVQSDSRLLAQTEKLGVRAQCLMLENQSGFICRYFIGAIGETFCTTRVSTGDGWAKEFEVSCDLYNKRKQELESAKKPTVR